ncbi:hypothetical protein Ade02nite_89480 [Paractinoplanes deccanensis]|uniref:Uncharacterized protein n=2 Tax=Paractinoplanes deccanensis TaxID=113561 RepID=A0ABQ3YJY2_9ACTN|nr:hypothetical protein Ade02nite_89480 [Actinoplanes deccanensis]
MRTGAVLAMAAGGSGERPLVAVLSAPGHTDDEGDHLRVWHVATGQVAAVPVPPARCVTASGEAGWRRVPSAVGGWATGGLWW